MNSIHVNGYEIPPADQVEGGKYFSADASHSNYILLQCQGFLSKEQHPELKKLHVQVLEYIPIHTYLCRYEPSDLSILRKLPFVVSANVFHQDFVTSQQLRSKFQTDAASREPGLPPASPPACHVSITLQPGADRTAAEIKDHLAEILHQDPNEISISGRTIRMPLHPRDWNTVAGIDEIRNINEVGRLVPLSNLARRTVKIPDRLRGLSQDALGGNAEIVAVADTGFDIGMQPNANPPPPSQPPKLLMFGDRVRTVIRIANRQGGMARQTKDFTGHGTFVCGCVAASGTTRDFAFTRTTIKGTAPKAQLVVQVMTDDDGGWVGSLFAGPRNYPDILNQAYDLGARIHNNSYGQKVTNIPPVALVEPYESGDYAASIDTYVRDTHPDMLVVIAAGNWQDGQDLTPLDPSIGEFARSKNSIVVGASETSRSILYTANPPRAYQRYKYQRLQRNGRPHSIAAFSSRGPDAPLPNKPDLVAPGVCIYSARSQDPDFQGLQVQADPPRYDMNKFGRSTDTNWIFQTGTSFSAPFVAGCAAVLRRALIETGYYLSPSAALIKALLINGATDLSRLPAGRRGPAIGLPPDPFQGFGLVNLEASLLHVTSPNAGFIQPEPIAQDSTWNTRIRTNPGQTFDLTATMVYNDREGAGLQAQLVLSGLHQDTGSAATITRYANGNGDQPDLFNNVQKLVWENLSPGKTTLAVGAHHIVPTDPPNPDGDRQDFTVVWYVTYH